MYSCLDMEYAYLFDGQKYASRADLVRKHGGSAFTAPIISSYDFSHVNESLNFKDALIQVLNRVKPSSSKPIYILYSGGIDSEVLLETCRSIKMDVVAITVNLFSLNHYDIFWAKKFCETHNIPQIIVDVSEEELKSYWLPYLFFTVQSPSPILSAAFIGALSAPQGSTVLTIGDGPVLLFKDSHQLYFSENEYGLWPLKLRQQLDIDIYDVFWDAQLYTSFLKYPQIYDRVFSSHPYTSWCYNASRLGKEYFYSDSNYAHLLRRFSIHGWESLEGPFGYVKDAVPDYDLSSSFASIKWSVQRYYDTKQACNAIWESFERPTFFQEQFCHSLWKKSKNYELPIPATFDAFTRAFYFPTPLFLQQSSNSSEFFKKQQVITYYNGEICNEKNNL